MQHPAYNHINAHSQTRMLLILPQRVIWCCGQHVSGWIGLSIYQRCPALGGNFSDQWLPLASEPSLIFQLSGPHTALLIWPNKGQTPLPSNNPLYAQSNSQLGLKKLLYQVVPWRTQRYISEFSFPSYFKTSLLPFNVTSEHRDAR